MGFKKPFRDSFLQDPQNVVSTSSPSPVVSTKSPSPESMVCQSGKSSPGPGSMTSQSEARPSSSPPGGRKESFKKKPLRDSFLQDPPKVQDHPEAAWGRSSPASESTCAQSEPSKPTEGERLALYTGFERTGWEQYNSKESPKKASQRQSPLKPSGAKVGGRSPAKNHKMICNAKWDWRAPAIGWEPQQQTAQSSGKQLKNGHESDLINEKLKQELQELRKRIEAEDLQSMRNFEQILESIQLQVHPKDKTLEVHFKETQMWEAVRSQRLQFQEIKNMRSKLQMMQNDFQRSQEQVQKQHQEIQALESTVQDKDHMIRILQQKLETKELELQVQAEAAEKSLRKSARKVDQLDGEVIALRIQLRQQKEEITSLKSQLSPKDKQNKTPRGI